MRAVNFFLALILMLAVSACIPAALPEQDTAVDTAVEASEQTDGGSAPTDAPEPTATVILPTETPEPTATNAPAETPEPLSEGDAGKIYAAAVRQMYSVDHYFGGDPPDFPLVYIVTTTTDGALLDAPFTEPQELSAELRQAIEADLTDQPPEIIWIESREEAPVDGSTGQIAGGEGIVITLGNILPQANGTAHLPIHMLCGPLCLSGKNYVLDQVDGAWQVTGSVGVVIEA